MTHKSTLIVAMILLFSGILLSSCESARTPADIIVEYLEALAEKDQTSAVANSCAAWEEKALAEGASFINVEVTLFRQLHLQLRCRRKPRIESQRSSFFPGPGKRRLAHVWISTLNLGDKSA